MLIRDAVPLEVSGGDHDAWELVDKCQRRNVSDGWLVPQPAHSALSGEIAAQLLSDRFTGITEAIRRAIALHDTGWSAFDAQQIDGVRRGPNFKPIPFVREKPTVFVRAWTDSIKVAEAISAESGYMVSRHFSSLNTESVKDEEDAARMKKFKEEEAVRQQRLSAVSSESAEALEGLVQALRFCDLLSLFLCCNVGLKGGARVLFQQRDANPSYALAWKGSEWSFGDNTPLIRRTELLFSGVRFGSAAKGGGWFHASIS